ncbi:MAG: nitrile hydratase accessory protein [Bauldia litoralis]
MTRVDLPGEADLAEVPALPRDDDGPVFKEPWEAQAFAMTVKLHQAGVFTWPEWVDALSAEIASAGAETDKPYYALWLAALEKLVTAKGVASADEMGSLKDAWRDAYLRTPHGQPVELGRE